MNTTCNEENHLEKKEQPWNTKAKIFMYKERQKNPKSFSQQNQNKAYKYTVYRTVIHAHDKSESACRNKLHLSSKKLIYLVCVYIDFANIVWFVSQSPCFAARTYMHV